MNDRENAQEEKTTVERRLEIYLNDHLAGSVAMRELIERRLSDDPGGALGDFLRRFQEELEVDQAAVKRMIAHFGGTENPAKKTLAWLAEKIGRLKLNASLIGYSELSRLEELEFMVVGIRGKLALWTALEAAAITNKSLREFDLAPLREKAKRQLDEAETLRLEAAKRAFG
jgi:hypothetical protein